MKIKVCVNCERIFSKSFAKKYCSHACQLEHQYKKYIEEWKVGKQSGLRGEYSVSQHVRKYLFMKYNNKCSRCGWSEINVHSGNIPLEVEHIDGNYKNSSEDNLTLLCPNCHSLTSSYRALNNGNGRKSRIKYRLQTTTSK